MVRALYLCFLFLAFFSLNGCNIPRVETLPSLTNQGQLGLSTTNPYLGANLFLSQELERSNYLYNFFKGRGAPTAIEIIEESYKPTKILLFYPAQKEVYVADLLSKDKIEVRQWVVRGPYQIERQDYKNLARMESAMNGEPVFVIWGKQHRFRFNRDNKNVSRVLTPLPPPIPTPRPKPPAKKVLKKPEDVDASVRDFRPLTYDQQAIQMSKGFAERADNGDVLHTVREGETLKKIGKWYAGAEVASLKIAEASGIVEGQEATAGAKVRIPLGIVRQFKLMPEGYQ